MEVKKINTLKISDEKARLESRITWLEEYEIFPKIHRTSLEYKYHLGSARCEGQSDY